MCKLKQKVRNYESSYPLLSFYYLLYLIGVFVKEISSHSQFPLAKYNNGSFNAANIIVKYYRHQNRCFAKPLNKIKVERRSKFYVPNEHLRIKFRHFLQIKIIVLLTNKHLVSNQLTYWFNGNEVVSNSKQLLKLLFNVYQEIRFKVIGCIFIFK